MDILCLVLGVVVCGLGISAFIGGLSLHKEAITSLFFDKDLMDCFIFSFVAFLMDGVGVVLFYAGYRIMENNV